MYATKSIARLTIAAFALLCLTACETVDDRIALHQTYFDGLPANTQTTLREGKVKLGFTETMARIAFGEPDVVRRTTNNNGEFLVWSYQFHRPVYEGSHLIGYRFYEMRRDGVQRVFTVPEYRDFYRYEIEEFLRLIFSDGKIVEIEQTQ